VNRLPCFERDELIEKIVGLAENLTSITLIGASSVGKTFIDLTFLYHGRTKRRFSVDRRFIRCDQFPVLCNHLLSRLSKIIGAGIEKPEDLASLRPFSSSRGILLVLGNAKIYAVVEGLSQFDNVCLCISSRI